MLAQLDRGADPNEELWPKSIFMHAPLTSATTHRMADEDVHRSKCPLKLPGLEQDVGGPAPLSIDVPEGARLRRFSMSRLIHRIAIKTSGGERLAETKAIFFRAGGSMSEQRNRMRTRRCGENSKRGCVCCQHYFFHADARFDHAKVWPQQSGWRWLLQLPNG